MNFKETLNEKTVRIEEILAKFLPEEQGYQKTVIEAMNYSILAGGKRLRLALRLGRKELDRNIQLLKGQYSFTCTALPVSYIRLTTGMTIGLRLVCLKR